MRIIESELCTLDNGPRPAGPPDSCFYCNAPLDTLHVEGCVLRQKVVMVRMSAEFPITVPQHWEAGDIEFHRNESTWCTSNVIEELDRLAEEFESCLCGMVKFQYAGDFEYSVEENEVDVEDESDEE